MVGRTWPIAVAESILYHRWNKLMGSIDRKTLFKDSPSGKKVHLNSPYLPPKVGTTQSIASLPIDTPAPINVRYGYRSFDRQWLVADGRLIDRPSPKLWRSHGSHQIYMVSLLTGVLGEGPAAVATSLIPDKDHFRGSFSGAHIIPLWRDIEATEPNVTKGILDFLTKLYNHQISTEDLFAYSYAILNTPQYVKKFWDELTIPGPRLPVTKDLDLFIKTVELGKKLLWLHTFGERFIPKGIKPGKLPIGIARCKIGTPGTLENYPETFSYDANKHELHVGKGIFDYVRPEVWQYSVSGLEIVKSWLSYRMRQRSGKKSSPLDNLGPQSWQFDEELLDLLWIIDSTIDLHPQMAQILNDILSSDLFSETDFPKPIESEHNGPNPNSPNMSLFHSSNVFADMDASEDSESIS
jgi:hypothetical protein